MRDLTIRPARIRDADGVARLLRRSYGQLLAQDHSEELLHKVLPVIARPRPELLSAPGWLVAVRAGEVLGCGGWTRATPQGGLGGLDVGHVRHVVADPDHLRQGIARASMQQAIQEAQAAGIGLLCCLSTRTAVPFHRSLGFAGSAEIELRLQPGLLFSAVEMRLTLG